MESKDIGSIDAVRSIDVRCRECVDKIRIVPLEAEKKTAMIEPRIAPGERVRSVLENASKLVKCCKWEFADTDGIQAVAEHDGRRQTEGIDQVDDKGVGTMSGNLLRQLLDAAGLPEC